MQKLKEILTRNFGLKLISLLLGFVVWLVVVNVSNPEITATKTVQIEVENENVLTALGKTYEFTNGGSVVVTYTVRTRDAYKISSSDFRAYVDMNNLYDVTGSVLITVEVVNNKGLFTSSPTCKPVILRVRLEDIIRNAVPVRAQTEGNPAEGYTVGTVDVNPSSITVRGPQSLVEEIAYAEIYVDVEGVSGDFGGNAKPMYFNNQGQLIEIKDDRISLTRESVDYNVNILVGKKVPVTYQVSGSAADGYAFVGVASNINEVTVLGDKHIIDGMSSVVVPPETLNVGGAENDKTVNVDISQFVPTGVTVVTDANANVTLRVEAKVNRSFIVPAGEITKTGERAGKKYMVGPGSIEVVINGLKKDLDALTPASLGASIDVSELEDGYHELMPVFTLPDTVTLDSTTMANVSVLSSDEYQEQETEVLSESQDSTESGEETE